MSGHGSTITRTGASVSISTCPTSSQVHEHVLIPPSPASVKLRRPWENGQVRPGPGTGARYRVPAFAITSASWFLTKPKFA